jgi:flavocytochrome c
MNQITIIGAGTAGMACAISAAECGANVTVIEKDSTIGGTLHVTAGHLSAGGSIRQSEKGIIDSPQKHYDDVMRISNHTADPTIVKLATDLAPKTIDWLQSLGFPFEPDTPKFIYGHTPYQTARTYWGTTAYEGTEIKWAGSAIYETMLPLWQKYIANGQIQVQLNTKLTKIIRNQQGEVTGVEIYKSENDTLSIIQAAVLVLTTGGYASNHAFFKAVTPSDWPRLVSTARETSTGDGIIAAMEVGAKFHNADKHTATLGGLELEPNSGRTDFWKNWVRVSNSVDRKPREIYVNTHALRFMDENEPDPDTREKAVEAQPDKKMWVIFDEKALYDEGGCIVPQWTPEKLKEEAKNQKAVWAADSIEKLAQKIGLDEITLKNTISQFNDFVVNQNDNDFGRTHLQNSILEGPFYAILTYCFSLVTFGGLATNADLQVLDTNNEPIPNLYAAGEVLGGGVTCGNAFVGGMFVTPALSFGRYLGQALAQTKP